MVDYQDQNNEWHVSHNNETQTIPKRDQYIEKLIDIQKHIYFYEQNNQDWADQIEFLIQDENELKVNINLKYDIWDKYYHDQQAVVSEQLLWENTHFGYTPDTEQDRAFIEKAKIAHEID